MKFVSMLLTTLALTPLAVLADIDINSKLMEQLGTAEKASSAAVAANSFSGMAMAVDVATCPDCLDIDAKIARLIENFRSTAEAGGTRRLRSPEKDRELCATGSNQWWECVELKSMFGSTVLEIQFPECNLCNGIRALGEMSSLSVDEKSDSKFVSVEDDYTALDHSLTLLDDHTKLDYSLTSLADQALVQNACGKIGLAVWAILEAADYKCHKCLQEEDANGACLVEYS